MRCAKCSTEIPAGAQFCPRCGGEAKRDSLDLPRAAGALPSTAPIPRIGKLFIAAGLVALALIGFGLSYGYKPVLLAGGALLGLVLLILLIGHHTS